MTAAVPAAGRPRPAAVRWRCLAWATWRQHRAASAAFTAVAGVIALAMAVTGFALHPYGAEVFAAGPHAPWRLYDVTGTTLVPALLLLPALAGLFLGAPLVARDYETGAARFAWVQGASRVRCLAAAVLADAVLLAITATVLGLEFRWWITPLSLPRSGWLPDLFSVSPLPFLGWMMFGFSLGVFLGAAAARTVAAMAATFACYAALWYGVSTSWRQGYLAPLHRAVAVHISDGGYTWSYEPRRFAWVLSSYLGWPGGRPFRGSLHHPAAWYSRRHIELWLSYQPASRLGTFQLIESGWLVALAAVLAAATFVLISRRAA
jgi:hypothetical protein